MKITKVLTGACLLALFVAPINGQQPDSPRHGNPAPAGGRAQAGALLGGSVAVDGAYAVAGAPGVDSGAVKVFDSAKGVLLHVLANPTPAPNDAFGHSVGVSGTLVVVGAYSDDTGAIDAGSAYVYDLAGATPTVPVLVLSNPDPTERDLFGFSVAISGTRVVVGAYQNDVGATDAGSVYVYDLAGATPAEPVATFHNPDPAANDQFGRSVAISGTSIVVGCWIDDTGAGNAGSAYIYDLKSAKPSGPVVTLRNPTPAANDNFGWQVAISGTRVVVGALMDDTKASNSGSAYLYDLIRGNPTVPVATLINPFPAADDNFGRSVAISGTRVVVGAYFDDHGAKNAGSAYVYEVASGTPTVPVATLNNPTPAIDDAFGISAAISGTRIVVGAYRDDTGANNAGNAYVYDLAGGRRTVPVATLNNPSPAGVD